MKDDGMSDENDIVSRVIETIQMLAKREGIVIVVIPCNEIITDTNQGNLFPGSIKASRTLGETFSPN